MHRDELQHNNNNNLFTINVIKYTFYLPKGRDLKIDNYYINGRALSIL